MKEIRPIRSKLAIVSGYFFILTGLFMYLRVPEISIIFLGVALWFLTETYKYHLRCSSSKITSFRSLGEKNIDVQRIQNIQVSISYKAKHGLVQKLTISSPERKIEIDLSLFHQEDICDLVAFLTKENPSIQLNELAKHYQKGNLSLIKDTTRNKIHLYLFLVIFMFAFAIGMWMFFMY